MAVLIQTMLRVLFQDTASSWLTVTAPTCLEIPGNQSSIWLRVPGGNINTDRWLTSSSGERLQLDLGAREVQREQRRILYCHYTGPTRRAEPSQTQTRDTTFRRRQHVNNEHSYFDMKLQPGMYRVRGQISTSDKSTRLK